MPDLAWLEGNALAEIEPHVRGLAAVHSPRTAVADFSAVAAAVAEEVTKAGATPAHRQPR